MAHARNPAERYPPVQGFHSGLTAITAEELRANLTSTKYDAIEIHHSGGLAPPSGLDVDQLARVHREHHVAQVQWALGEVEEHDHEPSSTAERIVQLLTDPLAELTDSDRRAIARLNIAGIYNLSISGHARDILEPLLDLYPVADVDHDSATADNVVITEGGSHTKITVGDRTTVIPRHNEVNELTTKAIYKQIGMK